MQYYIINAASVQEGPFNLDQLSARGLTKDSLVWKEGLKDWIKAGEVPELASLFIAAPPPFVPKPPVPDQVAPVKTGPPPPGTGPLTNRPVPKPINKLIVPIAGIVILIALAAWFFLRRSVPKNEDGKSIVNTDSLQKSKDTSNTSVPEEKDTVKLVKLDTLLDNVNWDTAATAANEEPGNTPAFLPGMGNGEDEKSAKKKTKKQAPTKKEQKQETDRADSPDPQPNQPERRTDPEKINPVKYLTITGGFRKNLLFEVLLEGTIKNRYSSQVKDIVIEVTFLDASGQPNGTKRFIQPGPIAGGASIGFRYKADAPKGTKGAKYELVSASLR